MARNFRRLSRVGAAIAVSPVVASVGTAALAEDRMDHVGNPPRYPTRGTTMFTSAKKLLIAATIVSPLALLSMDVSAFAQNNAGTDQQSGDLTERPLPDGFQPSGTRDNVTWTSTWTESTSSDGNCTWHVQVNYVITTLLPNGSTVQNSDWEEYSVKVPCAQPHPYVTGVIEPPIQYVNNPGPPGIDPPPPPPPDGPTPPPPGTATNTPPNTSPSPPPATEPPGTWPPDRISVKYNPDGSREEHWKDGRTVTIYPSGIRVTRDKTGKIIIDGPLGDQASTGDNVKPAGTPHVATATGAAMIDPKTVDDTQLKGLLADPQVRARILKMMSSADSGKQSPTTASTVKKPVKRNDTAAGQASPQNASPDLSVPLAIGVGVGLGMGMHGGGRGDDNRR
jgi:hypothetical protein